MAVWNFNLFDGRFETMLEETSSSSGFSEMCDILESSDSLELSYFLNLGRCREFIISFGFSGSGVSFYSISSSGFTF